MKKGDKVVCIDDEGEKLTFGKIYIVVERQANVYFLESYENYVIPEVIFINNDDNIFGVYLQERFITLKDFRKQKLSNLNKI